MAHKPSILVVLSQYFIRPRNSLIAKKYTVRTVINVAEQTDTLRPLYKDLSPRAPYLTDLLSKSVAHRNAKSTKNSAL